MCSFECIGLHFKAIFRRFAGGKSRESNAEMQFEVPKMHVRDFRNTLYSQVNPAIQREPFPLCLC